MLTKEQFMTLALADYLELKLDTEFLEQIHHDNGVLRFSSPAFDYWVYRCELQRNGSRKWFKLNANSNGWIFKWVKE